MACIEAINRLNWRLDEIVTVDVNVNDNLSGNHPKMLEFKKYVDAEILKRYGYEVRHICGKTFEDIFYKKKIRGKYQGLIYGFPISSAKGGWCMKYLKIEPFQKYVNSLNTDVITYIGIAADETERAYRSQEYKYPLIEVGWTEQDCFRWCKENDLLSPVYESSTRDGCWFCPKQNIAELRKLYHEYPDLWQMMLDWDADSPIIFRSDGGSVKNFDKRFELEDKGLVPKDRKFRWKMLDEFERKTEVEEVK